MAITGLSTTVLLLLSMTLTSGKEEACHSFGEGLVYPRETAKGSHTLSVSKALISKPAPHWEGAAVVNGEFKDLNLDMYKGKYLVFFFYPLDFTFVCPTEIIAFRYGLRRALEPAIFSKLE